MKIILLLVALLPLCAQYAAAQQLTWELRAGERLLLRGTDSGRTDTVRITASDMSRLSEIKIRFQEKASNLSWRYILVCADITGGVLLESPCPRTNNTCSLPLEKLRAMARGSRHAWLSLEQHPADPDSFIRSRRTPLAVLEFPDK
jgi:hypothetical protein